MGEERVIDMHRVITEPPLNEHRVTTNVPPWAENTGKNIKSTQSYIRNRKKQTEKLNEFDIDDKTILQNEFPHVDIENCMLVTSKNLYFIELTDLPHILFLNMAHLGQWNLCEEFCKMFNLNFYQCVEYAGDVLLKKQKTTQALQAYNVARVK